MSRQSEAHLVVEPIPRNVRVARQFLREALQEWGSTHLEDTAVLLVSELLTNVILHAGTPGELSVVRAEGRVRVEVRDAGAPLPASRRYVLEGTTGRGLKLVSALSADWGVEPAGTGKMVWFELDETDADGRGGPPGLADARSGQCNGGGASRGYTRRPDQLRGGWYPGSSGAWRPRPDPPMVAARVGRALTPAGRVSS